MPVLSTGEFASSKLKVVVACGAHMGPTDYPPMIWYHTQFDTHPKFSPPWIND